MSSDYSDFEFPYDKVNEKQARYVRMRFEERMSYREIGIACGVDNSSVVRGVQRAFKRVGLKQPTRDSLDTGGLGLVKVSKFSKDGEEKHRWEIYHKEAQDLETEIETFVEAANEKLPVRPRIPKPKRKKQKWKDSLLNLYILTDAHINMLAWDEETNRGSWDLNIAEHVITKAFEWHIESSPDARVGYFCQLGDFAHFDSMLNETPRGRNRVDADGRPQKMVRTGIRIMQTALDLMLQKYEQVEFLCAEGNHDVYTSAIFREFWAHMMRDNPRCNVVTSAFPFYAYEHGDQMLGFHHGHKVKPTQVNDKIANSFRDMFGRTKSLVCHTGHRHHRGESPALGGKVEIHEALIEPDAHGAHGPWHDAERGMTRITYHKKAGEIGRESFRPCMLD